MKSKILLLLAVLLYLPFNFAQTDSTKEDWKWEWQWDEMDWGFKKSMPALSLNYGLAQMNRNDLVGTFADPNLIELKIGYIKEKPTWETENIIKQNYKFLYIANESTDLSGKTEYSDGYQTNMWRFGIGSSGGYGYKLSENAAIVPYYSTTLNWTNIDIKPQDILTLVPNPDDEILNLYDESFRFGTSSEGGVRVKVIKNLMFEAGYERSIVFQRHLFWKWAGSAIIEVAAQGLLDTFIDEVFESSPNAGPIVNFLLKNALAYGIYELRQEKMNWPFPSEAPIAYDQFKFGVTVVF